MVDRKENKQRNFAESDTKNSVTSQDKNAENAIFRTRDESHVATMEKGRSAFKFLTGKPTGTRPLGRPKRRWEYGPSRDRYQCGELY